MNKRITVVLGLAIFIASLAASVLAAVDRVNVAINDPTKVPAMMAGMSDEQAVQFARDSIAALNKSLLSPETKRDRLALLTVGLISGASMQSMQQVAAAVVSSVRGEDLAKTTAVVAMVISVRQTDFMAMEKTTSAVELAGVGRQPVAGIIGGGIMDRKPRVIAALAAAPAPAPASAPATSAKASNSSGVTTLSGGGDAVVPLSSHTTIITPPESLPDDMGTPSDPQPETPDVPVAPPAPPPAPYYEGQ